MPGFLEYVTFSGVGDGHEVYPRATRTWPGRRRWSRRSGRSSGTPHDMGMQVYLLTDMLAVSPPLEAYLDRTVGGLDVEDPALWSVYQAGPGRAVRAACRSSTG